MLNRNLSTLSMTKISPSISYAYYSHMSRYWFWPLMSMKLKLRLCFSNVSRLYPTVGAIFYYYCCYCYCFFDVFNQANIEVFPELSRPTTRILTFYFENALPIIFFFFFINFFYFNFFFKICYSISIVIQIQKKNMKSTTSIIASRRLKRSASRKTSMAYCSSMAWMPETTLNVPN